MYYFAVDDRAIVTFVDKYVLVNKSLKTVTHAINLRNRHYL